MLDTQPTEKLTCSTFFSGNDHFKITLEAQRDNYEL